MDFIEYDHDIYHKIHGPLAIEAKNVIHLRVIDEQSVGVDGITGATISSNSILLSIARAVEEGFDGQFTDGVYSGYAIGRKDAHYAGIITVGVVILNNKI